MEMEIGFGNLEFWRERKRKMEGGKGKKKALNFGGGVSREDEVAGSEWWVSVLQFQFCLIIFTIKKKILLQKPFLKNPSFITFVL